MRSQKHDFQIGDEVYIPLQFAQHKFQVAAGETFTVDKLVGEECICVSNDERSLKGHFSHFSAC